MLDTTLSVVASFDDRIRSLLFGSRTDLRVLRQRIALPLVPGLMLERITRFLFGKRHQPVID